jgi:hypothetical protein
MPKTAIETAVDSLLQVIVMGEREAHARNGAPALGTLMMWPALDAPLKAPDIPGPIDDPIRTARRAELCRLGCDIYAVGGLDALDEAILRIVDLDPTHAEWRTIVLEAAWGEIGREPA